ncbi:MAG TPA: phenylalanine--tRNA ligase subunit beta [Bacteroidales bacterium]|nr:phenylalanine--tRNA ligase subunit beta [Bacteroidales bacterium]
MKISLNWLKQYITFDLPAEETGKLLTSCGLEVESIEPFETIKGGLKGLIIGEVLTCEKHPDSDHLHLTTVHIGSDTPLHIVCGASNVAAGQKVVVATIGTTLYSDDSSFVIKKSKIRGAVSEGMICAEDEIGIGKSHDGIMVLPADTPAGLLASEYFNIETDYIFEIGITPNRSDATSHYGVARDLFAVLKHNGIACSQLLLPSTTDIIPTSKKNKITIEIENTAACPRYTGLCFENIEVTESPEWLQNRLKSIGVRPVNNIVDITQYIMFEIGQPLHAFDSDFISGDQVIIKNLPSGSSFITLDGNEIKLHEEDLMICNQKDGMCIAGVYGGIHSGVTEKTKNIFLESAYFNPVSVRKTSKRHSLKTDAAFRFERGCDPDITLYAIKRAANLIQEIAGGSLVSEIMDVYPNEIAKPTISLSVSEVENLIGKPIELNTISNILLSLGFEINHIAENQLLVTVPLNKTDITRPIDLIEDILRIYGYNNVEIPEVLHYAPNLKQEKSNSNLQKTLSLLLTANGFFEIMNNSITTSRYAEMFDFINENERINLVNPLSSDLNAMRQSLLFSGLETIIRNLNNRNNNLKLFEFGKTYHLNPEKIDDSDVTIRYMEKEMFSIFITGEIIESSWNQKAVDVDFFYLKNLIHNILSKTNFPVEQLQSKISENSAFLDHLVYTIQDQVLVQFGQVHPKILKQFEIKKPVFYGEIDFKILFSSIQNRVVQYTPIPSFPSVKRDLALVVDKTVSYQNLEEIAYKYGSSKLKKVSLFDVYEGEKIEQGKKSYALNFVLQHGEKTLTEEEISKTMKKLIAAFERECGAKLR